MDWKGTNARNKKLESRIYATIGNSDDNCAVAAGTNPGLIHSTCSASGTDGSTIAVDASNATLRINLDLSNTFVEKSSAESSNLDVAPGGTGFPGAPNIFDWFSFDNRFRAWGRFGTFGQASSRGRWTSGTGAVWDMRLKSSDLEILDRTYTGANANGTFTAGSSCPTAVSGTVFTQDQDPAGVSTYLWNAFEIVDSEATGYSATGDHDGLCESNESCLYTPNFGAYQGSGTVSTCNFSDGTVSGVTMYGYPQNGI